MVFVVVEEDNYIIMEKQYLIELAVKASKGDKKSFDDLCEAKAKSILYNALTIMKNHHDAEDAAQEVFVRMYKSINKLNNPEAVNTWVQRIVTNVCFNMLKKKKRRKEDYYMENEEVIVQFEEKNNEFLPYEYYENNELRELVIDAVRSLPEKRRRCICLYYYDHMSYSEISKAMGISVNTVSTNILRGKITIKEYVEAETGKEISTEKIKKNQTAGFAAMPVLSQILLFDANQCFPAAQVLSYTKVAFGKIGLLAGAAKLGATNTAATGIPFVIKIALSVIAITTLMTSGTMVVTNNNINDLMGNGKQQEKPISATKEKNPENNFNADGKIIFNTGECECGHLNPKNITADYDNINPEKSKWQLLSDKSESQKNVLYAGEGSVIKKPLLALAEEKKDGDYFIRFTLTDKNGNSMTLKRKFTIDTGEVKAGNYE